MARKQYQSKARMLRSDSEQVPANMPTLHRVWCGVVLDVCLHAGIGFYVGRWGVSGKITVRFYVDDDAVETFLSVRDNPAEWAADTLKAIVSEALAAEALKRGLALAGSAASSGSPKA